MAFVLRALSALAAAVPWRCLRAVGAVVGWIAGSAFRIRRAHVEAAMRAAGVSSRKVVLPVLFFATLCAGAAGYASLRLTPVKSVYSRSAPALSTWSPVASCSNADQDCPNSNTAVSRRCPLKK